MIGKLDKDELVKILKQEYKRLENFEKNSGVRISLHDFNPEMMVSRYLESAAEYDRLNKNETCGISLLKPKTNALFFDRIWCPFLEDYPSAIGFSGYSKEEMKASSALFIVSLLVQIWILSDLFKSGTNRFPVQMIDRSNIYRIAQMEFNDESMNDFITQISENAAKSISNFFYLNNDIVVTPSYSSTVTQQKEYQPGNYSTIIASINSLKIVNEDNLDWEQVQQFRDDPEAKKKYRKFIHWLDKEMIGKEQSYVQDEIAGKLEGYEWALKRHGIKTVKGAIFRIINKDAIIKAGSVGAGFMSGEWLLTLPAITMALGDAVVSVMDYKLKKKDILHNHEDIAYIHEVKKLGEDD